MGVNSFNETAMGTFANSKSIYDVTGTSLLMEALNLLKMVVDCSQN